MNKLHPEPDPTKLSPAEPDPTELNHHHKNATLTIETSNTVIKVDKEAQDTIEDINSTTDSSKTDSHKTISPKTDSPKTDSPKQSVKDFLFKDAFLEGFIWE